MNVNTATTIIHSVFWGGLFTAITIIAVAYFIFVMGCG